MTDRLTVSTHDLRRLLDAADADRLSPGVDGIPESVLEAIQALVPCNVVAHTAVAGRHARRTEWCHAPREGRAGPYGEWITLTGGRFAVLVPLTRKCERDDRAVLVRDEGFSDRELLLLRLLRPHLLELERLEQRRNGRLPLTGRQSEVLRLVADGLTNRQIARRLDLSEGTVRTHLMHAFKRLGIHSRAAAASLVANGT